MGTSGCKLILSSNGKKYNGINAQLHNGKEFTAVLESLGVSSISVKGREQIAIFWLKMGISM